MYRSLGIITLGILVEGLVGSCVPIQGGSVEVSWAVRDANGRAINDCSCTAPQIAAVRIELVGKGGSIAGTTPCAGRAQCQFSCQRQTGATPFDIPPTQGDEQYLISVIPVDKDGKDLLVIRRPAAISRTVVNGQPTEVEAFLLEAGCAPECGGMNKSGVCARP